VLSGKGDPIRAGLAMDNVVAQLVDKEAKIIRLFTPTFEHTDKEPDYIKGYPLGVRENGGQYTHAATWVAYALTMMGRFDETWQAFDLLNPINHALREEVADTYRVKPYIVTADVYGADTRTGRGGWTWYTGSSGWLYRTAIEAILGIELKDGKLTVNPRIPSHWDGYTAKVRIGGKKETIIVRRIAGTKEFEIERT
jgi:cyclic beta-1,2-glucan synthetase